MAAGLDIAEAYRRWRAAVFSRCRRLLGNDADAVDATHEVFLKLLEHADQFRGSSQLTTYLYAIASRVCLDRLRHKLVRGEDWTELLNQWEEGRRESFDLEGQAVARAELTRALASADEQTTLMVLHCHVEGLTQQEAADILGVSRVTVNVKLGQFAERLRGGTS